MKIESYINKYSIVSVNPEQTNFKWHFEIVGRKDAPPLLWLHGFMGSGMDWLVLVETHFSEFCNILVDLPGHGESQITESMNYLELLDSLTEQLHLEGMQNFIPIGYSMGGRLAMHLYDSFPESIPAMILVSSSPGLKTEIERAERINSDNVLMDKMEHMGIEAFLQEWYRLPLFQNIAQNPDLFDNLVETRSNNSPMQLRRSLEILGTGALPSCWEKLPDWDIPVLLISGSSDSKYCEINAEMAGEFPRSEHVIIEEGDHAIHIEKALETAVAIRHFVRASI